MTTSGEIYEKIQQISNKYVSGHPPIHICSIANELGITKASVAEHIETLENLKLIESMETENEVIFLA